MHGIPLDLRAKLAETYRSALLGDIVPWWSRNSFDRDYGGSYSCINRDGSLYAQDKYTWMMGRQVWMLSHLYNRLEARSDWLDAALNVADFLLEHAMTDTHKMYFRLTREGLPLANCLSLFSECFTALGLAELSRASGKQQYWDRAVEMYDHIRPRLGRPTDKPADGYRLFGEFHIHGHDMVRMTLMWAFNEISPEQRWQDDLTMSVESLISRHWKPELGALLENVAPDGTALLDLPDCRLVNPGHAIESMWMVMEIARSRNDDKLMDTACEIVLRSLELGWDQEYGGLRLFVNVDGSPPNPLAADMKLWWPHVESLFALLQAWDYTGSKEFQSWYERVHEYTFEHFPDSKHGEWYGHLNRDGSPVSTVKANGWKGFFHIPRVLLRACELLDITKEQAIRVDQPHGLSREVNDLKISTDKQLKSI